MGVTNSIRPTKTRESHKPTNAPHVLLQVHVVEESEAQMVVLVDEVLNCTLAARLPLAPRIVSPYAEPLHLYPSTVVGFGEGGHAMD